MSLAILQPHGYPVEIVAIYENGDVHQLANYKKLPEGYPENCDIPVRQQITRGIQNPEGFLCF